MRMEVQCESTNITLKHPPLVSLCKKYDNDVTERWHRSGLPR